MGQAVELPGPVPTGVKCRQCKYDLRGWHTDAPCPECGLDIAISTLPLVVTLNDPASTAQLLSAFTCTQVSVILTLIALPAGGLAWDLGLPFAAALATPLVGAGLRARSTWLLTTSLRERPWAAHTSKGIGHLRWLAMVDAVIHLGACAVGIVTDPGWWILVIPLAACLGFSVVAYCLAYVAQALLNPPIAALGRFSGNGIVTCTIAVSCAVLLLNYSSGRVAALFLVVSSLGLLLSIFLLLKATVRMKQEMVNARDVAASLQGDP